MLRTALITWITAVFLLMATGALAGTVTVTGEGTQHFTPDSAHLTFTALGKGSSVAQAQQALGQSLRQWDRQIKTMRDRLTDYSDATVTVYSLRESDHRQVKVASRQISFRLTDLKLLDKLLAAADGANFQYRLDGNDFYSSQQDQLSRDALAAAIRDARGQCRFVAQQLGETCGEVKTMQVSRGAPRPRPLAMSARARGPAPVEVGRQSLHVTVNASFEIH